MARSSRIGRGQVVVSCWTASACFLLYHRSLFGIEPWHLSTFSTCFALRRCFFMYLPLCLQSSEVLCFRRFFCSFSCCWCSCCCRCFCHCCICFSFFAVCRRCPFSKDGRGAQCVKAEHKRPHHISRHVCAEPACCRIKPLRLDDIHCGSNPISGRSPQSVESIL